MGKIGIIGAGALGAFYGARLARAGHNVHFLMRRDYEVVKLNGLSVKSCLGDFHIAPPVYDRADTLGVCDLVVIGLKSTDNQHLQSLLEPVCGPTTLVLTLQNGLGNEEAVISALASTRTPSSTELASPMPDLAMRVLGGIAFLCSNRIAPGVIHHIDHGWIKLGQYQSAAGPRTQTVATLFRNSGIRCDVYHSLLTARWEKLVWNIPFNGLGVSESAHTAAVLANSRLKQLARDLMFEVVNAAAADSVVLSPDLPDKMMRNTETMGPYRTSMQIDFEEGRPLEIEAIIGEPLRRARKAAIPTPGLEKLYEQIHRANR